MLLGFGHLCLLCCIYILFKKQEIIDQKNPVGQLVGTVDQQNNFLLP